MSDPMDAQNSITFTHQLQDRMLSVCVVTRNASASLERLLRSLERSIADSMEWEAIVVDNDSSDDTPTMLKREFPNAEYILCQPGVGFSKGINEAVMNSRGEYILIATPSTEIVGDAVPTLIAHLDEFEDIGVVGPKVIHPDGSTQHSSKRMPNPRVAMLHTFYMLGLIRSSKILNEYFLYDYESEESLPVESLTMSLLVTRRAVFEQIGLLDEGMFAWSSDVDWCYRVASSDWKQLFIPSVKVIHRRSSVSKKQPIANLIHYHRDLRYFYKKHYAKRVGPLMNLVWTLMLFGRLLVQIVRFALKRNHNYSFY